MNSAHHAWRTARAIAIVAAWATLPAPQVFAQQSPATTRPAQPGGARGTAPAARASATAAQGFSVVLVLGDLQGAAVTDDVPIAARKALNDMREFLPFKSYRLLDAAWILCCGERRPASFNERGREPARNNATQILRGPDDQEYELRLTTSRVENSRINVNFVLLGSETREPVAMSEAAAQRTLQRRIADLKDRSQLLENQIAEAMRRKEVGVSPGTEIPKLQLELRSTQREIEDLAQRASAGAASGATVARSAQRGVPVERSPRGPVMDTSFTMDVGETVVVGTSRLRGGTRALIALLTSVPARGANAAR